MLSFEQNIMDLSLRCFIPSFVEIGPLVPGENIFKVSLPYLGMVAILVGQHYVNEFSLHCSVKLTYKIWLEMAWVFMRDANFNFH